MKFLKLSLRIVLILISIPLLLALVLKNDYEVEQKVTIQKPNDEVFEYIKYLKNQSNYSKWANMDPNMKKSYKGTDGTVGFVSAWNSKNPKVGKGEQEIINIIEGDRIDYELRFLEPFQATEPAFMLTRSTSETATEVTWGFSGHMNYPMNLMLFFTNLEDDLTNDIDTGLKNLKAILEK